MPIADSVAIHAIGSIWLKEGRCPPYSMMFGMIRIYKGTRLQFKARATYRLNDALDLAFVVKANRAVADGY